MNISRVKEASVVSILQSSAVLLLHRALLAPVSCFCTPPCMSSRAHINVCFLCQDLCHEYLALCTCMPHVTLPAACLNVCMWHACLFLFRCIYHTLMISYIRQSQIDMPWDQPFLYCWLANSKIRSVTLDNLRSTCLATSLFTYRCLGTSLFTLFVNQQLASWIVFDEDLIIFD